MGEFLKLAGRRRSVRKYLADEVSDEVLGRILEAARIAPSGNNSQPWRFIVVRDKEIKKRLYKVAGEQQWILDAPVIIAIVADIQAKMKKLSFIDSPPSVDDPKNHKVLVKTVRDAAIAAEHLVMAATDEGLGTCWVAMFEQEDIKPVLKVPANGFVVAIITVGRPAETPNARPRHNIWEIAFKDQFGHVYKDIAKSCGLDKETID